MALPDDPTRKVNQHIVTCESDRKFVTKFEDEVASLAGMVIEMMTTERTALLSPIFRKLLLDKARVVESMRLATLNRLCCDNLGEPLKPVEL